MDIYLKKDRVPYTYLIGWKKLSKFYYGRRTAKGCHPDEFWKTYFTSSVYVKEFIKENGNPDIIQIRRTFNDVKTCEKWEHRVLSKINAATNANFINQHNGGSTFSTTGKVAVRDKNGKTFLVDTQDQRLKNDELIVLSKGRKASSESNSRKANGKGKIAVRNMMTGKCCLMDKTLYDREKDFGIFVPVCTGKNKSSSEKDETSKRKKGKVVVKDSFGNIFEVTVNDPLYLSGEYVHISKGTYMAIDNTGKIFRTTKDDPRWETGEIKNPYKDKPNLKLKGVSKPKKECSYCKRMISNNMFYRYHDLNCKEKK